MKLKDLDKNNWKNNEDWELLDDNNTYFFKELTNELTENHLLYNRVTKAIMRRFSQDDVLYLLEDGTYAIVHLTYSKDNLQGWPKYKKFTTVEAVNKYIELL